ILQGRDVYQKAVTKPDSLADHMDPDDGDVEWDGSPGRDAWFTVTKTKDNDAGYRKLDAAERARYGDTPPMPDLGDGWDFDDEAEMRKRLPRLTALYWDEEDEE